MKHNHLGQSKKILIHACAALAIVAALLLTACALAPIAAPTATDTPEKPLAAVTPETSEKPVADVTAVQVTGAPGAYQFAVEIRSPDQGCDQYADWWEVLSAAGELLYRRILTHSHVNEQPFVRAGGPIPIAAADVVYVRAHLHPTGYGGRVLQGSVEAGFETVAVDATFATAVETAAPQPTGCAF